MPTRRTGTTRPAGIPGGVTAGGDAAARSHFARDGLMRLLGTWLEIVEPGHAVVEVPWSDRIAGAGGTVHTAVASALAESAAGCAVATVLPAGSGLLTVEYKINFLKPEFGDRVRAAARIVRQGRSLTVTEAEISVISQDAATTVAIVQATYLRTEAGDSDPA